MQTFISFLWHFLLYLLISLPMVLVLYPLLCRALDEPRRSSNFWPCILLLFANLATNRLAAFVANGLNIVTSLLFFFLIVRFVFRRRGADCLLCMVRIVVLLSATEAVCMVLLYAASLLGFDQSKLMVLTLKDYYRVETVFWFSLLNSAATLLVYQLMLIWLRLFGRHKPEDRRGGPRIRQYLWAFLRVTLLVFSGLGMLTMPFSLYGDQSLIQYLLINNGQYVLLSLCCAVLMLTVFYYLVQDLRCISQQDHIDTLTKQRALPADLMRSLRYFRHNMVNMLYGLEGYIINGDREKLNAYYAEIRHRCALVNNDNIAALEQVPSPAVNALLLHQLDKALKAELPLNLYVEQGLTIPRILSDAELCQVLGVLLDNATEAALAAPESSVTIEMSNVDGALEIIIKNTYAGKVTPEALTRGGQSTKQGHGGQGLSSCYQLLARRRGAFLNFWVTGQYVQAQLLLQR